MRRNRGLSICLTTFLYFVTGCTSAPQAQTPLTTLQPREGGIIVYGQVDGATTPASAMAHILRIVQNDCGDKPRVGKVFRVRDSNSDAVFFTVTNREHGNKAVAGMLIAAPTSPKTVEAALVSDDAQRFGSTVNPMLSQLFGVWHPGPAPTGRGSAASGGPGSLPPMRQVSLPDGTASVSVPAGWNLNPQLSGGGSAEVLGPEGERIGLNFGFLAEDPRGPAYINRMRMGIRPPTFIVVYPSNADLTRSFPDIFQRLRASNRKAPAQLQVDNVQLITESRGQCVNATGQVNTDGTGMREFTELLCRTPPDQYGDYRFSISISQIPLGATDQKRAIAAAIMASYQVDMQLVEARATAEAAPHIAQMQQNWQAQQQAMIANGQRIVGQYKQIGANATARMAAVNRMNDQQHADWERGQDINSRNVQGFSNYILDQTVVQDNNMYGNGTIGHGTLWNSTADALVKAYPDRYEYVDKPNYWRGTDYVP